MRGPPYEVRNIRYALPRLSSGTCVEAKLVRMYRDRPIALLKVSKSDRVGFDEAILPESSWVGDLAEDELEVEIIPDVRSGRRTLYCRVHRQLKVYWKGYIYSSWVEEADLNLGSFIKNRDRQRENKNQFNVM